MQRTTGYADEPRRHVSMSFDVGVLQEGVALVAA